VTVTERFSDLRRGLMTAPTRSLGACLMATLVYALMAFGVGRLCGFLTWEPIDVRMAWPLLIAMVLFPVLPEEVFFRGLLIPNALMTRKPTVIVSTLLGSSLLFTLWHPLNAALFNPAARVFFYNPAFLLVVFLLGLTCSYCYALSKSLWMPIWIHWMTIALWVFLFGGHSLTQGILGSR
jgi:uncharacterized protein